MSAKEKQVTFGEYVIGGTMGGYGQWEVFLGGSSAGFIVVEKCEVNSGDFQVEAYIVDLYGDPSGLDACAFFVHGVCDYHNPGGFIPSDYKTARQALAAAKAYARSRAKACA